MNIAIKDTSLEDIIRRIDAGEKVTLTRDGKPFARIEPTPVSAERPRLPRVGAFEGQFELPDDWDEIETGMEKYQ